MGLLTSLAFKSSTALLGLSIATTNNELSIYSLHRTSTEATVICYDNDKAFKERGVKGK